ncbi:MAG TPA: hypothetical protein QGH10_09020, partial [Armatimonadota bacterium]|nr:hypothetical protein [Armatimonadota bacterium]
TETMDRLINMFPPRDQHMICLRMSKTLKAVLSQALVPRADAAGRVCGLEIMRVTPTISKVIEENRPGEAYPLIADGEFWGMATKNQSLLKHYTSGKISPQSALFYAGNYTEMRQMLRRANPNVDLTDKDSPLAQQSAADDKKADVEDRRKRRPSGTQHPGQQQQQQQQQRPGMPQRPQQQRPQQQRPQQQQPRPPGQPGQPRK